jgi:FemAB-related protein (PEP-CTERM system-associated)
LRDAFVRAHPRATFFHQSRWGRLVQRLYGHEPRDLVAWREGRVVGVLPLALCRGPLGRRNLLSIPYAVYGGPLGADAAIEARLVEAGVRLAEELRVGRLELRFREDPANGMPGTDLYWTFVRELPERPEDVLARMPKKARAEARKARERSGLELTEGEWYVDDLYRLFLRNKQVLGSPGLPARHFHAIQAELGPDVHVHLVRRGRRPLAAVMSFAFRDTLIAYYAGTEPGADRECSASNFMYMALQEWAVERGFRTFDFCRSRADSGAFGFKRHQGFEPTQLHYRFHLVRDRRPPSFTPSNPRTRALRNAWTRLPSWCARGLSERLARYLP